MGKFRNTLKAIGKFIQDNPDVVETVVEQVGGKTPSQPTNPTTTQPTLNVGSLGNIKLSDFVIYGFSLLLLIILIISMFKGSYAQNSNNNGTRRRN